MKRPTNIALTLRLDPELLSHIDDITEELRMTRSDFCTALTSAGSAQVIERRNAVTGYSGHPIGIGAMSHVLKQVQVHEPFITTDGESMTVSIALPKRIVADLERIGNPGQPSLKLSRPQLVATCVAYALYSCRGTEGPGADDDFVDLALRLMALQPSSRVSLDTD